jgi:hypothetical protein
VKISYTNPFLHAALILLLLVFASSHTISQVSTGDAYLSGSTLSAVGMPKNLLGNPKSDNPEAHRATEWVSQSPQKTLVTSSANPGPKPDIAFTVSQARAPPQL